MLLSEIISSPYKQTKTRYPREFGNPARLKYKPSDLVWNNTDLSRYLTRFNNHKDCFISLYSFQIIDTWPEYYDSAIIDCLFFDIDSENLETALSETVKLVNGMLSDTLSPRVHFSGSKGFHIFCDFSPIPLKGYKNQTLKVIHDLLIKRYDLDPEVVDKTGNCQQLIRLVNTQNMKSGLFCIPLSIEDLFKLNAEDIKEKARTLQPYPVDPLSLERHNAKLSKLVLKVNKRITKRAEREKEIREILKKINRVRSLFRQKHKKYGKTPPCISKILEKANSGINLEHNERFTLTTWFLRSGYNEDQILDIFRNQPDFKPEKTAYQIHHIMGHKYRYPSCETRKSWGLCVETCPYSNQIMENVEVI
jgi:hypothetical protein